MERVFSVDDILGTFWKLDTQGDGGGGGGGGGHGSSSHKDLQRLASQNSLLRSNSGHWSGSAATPSGHQMNRSSSEWAFQEFLKEHTGPAVASHGYSADSSPRFDEHSAAAAAHHLSGGPAESPGALSPLPPFSPPFLASSGGGVRPLFSDFPEEASPSNPQEYADMLKHRLAMACAVASTRVAASAQLGSYAAPPRPPAVDVLSPGNRLSASSSDASGRAGAAQLLMPAPLGIPALPPKPDLAARGAMPAPGGAVNGSGSSREQSDEEGARSEGEDELLASLENVTDPDEIKRIKRMLSNRESARRSRRRKQAHLSDLELQVAQLRMENSGLAKRLSEIGHKYNDAAVDNRVLKSDVEALRAKVKMAEEMVGRAQRGSGPPYGLGGHQQQQPAPRYHSPGGGYPVGGDGAAVLDRHAPPYGPSLGMGEDGSSHQSHDARAPHHPPGRYLPPGGPMLAGGIAQPSLLQQQQQQPCSRQMDPQIMGSGSPRMDLHQSPSLSSQDFIDQAAVGMKMERTPSMQRVASLEHLQKRSRPGQHRDSPWGTAWEEDTQKGLQQYSKVSWRVVRHFGTILKNDSAKDEAS
eukprot:SM000152S01544  [mRNA]  locus=s152:106263:111399:+ [translate_table: standard]